MCYQINKGGLGVFPGEPMQPAKGDPAGYPARMVPLRNVLRDDLGNKYYFDDGWNLVTVAEKPKSLDAFGEANKKQQWIFRNPSLAYERFRDSWSMIERALAVILFNKGVGTPAEHEARRAAEKAAREKRAAERKAKRAASKPVNKVSKTAVKEESHVSEV